MNLQIYFSKRLCNICYKVRAFVETRAILKGARWSMCACAFNHMWFEPFGLHLQICRLENEDERSE